MRTKYNKEKDELSVNLINVRNQSLRTARVNVDIHYQATTKGVITNITIFNLKKQLMNRITVEDEEQPQFQPGELVKFELDGESKVFIITINKQWPSWNLVSLVDGDTYFSKDRRQYENITKELVKLNAVKISTVKLDNRK